MTVASGFRRKKNVKEITVRDFKFQVIIPDNLDDNGIDAFKALYHKRYGLNNATTGTIALAKRISIYLQIRTTWSR
jgi:hypothetical protein